ncbi:hypothetical protein H6P81_012359 [Aristolochia fimbriata]|uniref:Uncharacterized protein n=1 Tax=Aristolochia fimbriata TaxID=158543 RepID=A0AAV7EED2_ARIFI|nr:hypothetical protein H6P81_012359 [Aristolochia fimbriata]
MKERREEKGERRMEERSEEQEKGKTGRGRREREGIVPLKFLLPRLSGVGSTEWSWVDGVELGRRSGVGSTEWSWVDGVELLEGD